jgi:threonine dehydrogenase-like Zn-dependent dehydrogenase
LPHRGEVPLRGPLDFIYRRSSEHDRQEDLVPARAYIEELLPDVLEGRIEPGRVFDRVVRLDEVPDGYRTMNDREAIKVMVEL